jgi:hypothetical protein
VLLRREGWDVGKKRVYRVYTEEGLALRRKRPQRPQSHPRSGPKSGGPQDTLNAHSGREEREGKGFENVGPIPLRTDMIHAQRRKILRFGAFSARSPGEPRDTPNPFYNEPFRGHWTH